MLEFLAGMFFGWIAALVGREMAEAKEMKRLEEERRKFFEKENYW